MVARSAYSALYHLSAHTVGVWASVFALPKVIRDVKVCLLSLLADTLFELIWTGIIHL